MHPAPSIIFFSTMTGAGYGLLGLLGVSAPFELLANDPQFGLSAVVVALLLITAGLLSSTFHLGRPERAWRALSQWRSSWLSREGVLALLTYIPAIIFVLEWIILERTGTTQRIAGIATTVLCAATVFTTSMIYASLKPVAAWNNYWVPPVYLCLASMSGMTLYIALLAWFDRYSLWATALTASIIIITALFKLKYWLYIDVAPAASSTESATGLGRFGKARLLQSPHTESNYLMKEMGFVIARRHAVKLRRLALWSGFILPLILILLSVAADHLLRSLGLTLAALLMLSGILTERWLFFAEAKHTVMLYY